jgi:hypothetical protein
VHAIAAYHHPARLPLGACVLGQPLVLSRAGGSLVGVGRTLCVLMPQSEPGYGAGAGGAGGAAWAWATSQVSHNGW